MKFLWLDWSEGDFPSSAVCKTNLFSKSSRPTSTQLKGLDQLAGTNASCSLGPGGEGVGEQVA